MVEGDTVGMAEGCTDGATVCMMEGDTVGLAEGCTDGATVCMMEGKTVGMAEGNTEGDAVCFTEGALLGVREGCTLGIDEGAVVFCATAGVISYNWYAQLPPHVSGPMLLQSLVQVHAVSAPVLLGH